MRVWYMKNYNLKFCMYSRLCMHEHFDVITNPYKYKYKTCQIFIHPFQKIMASAKCNSWVVDLHSKWMIQFMCKC
jgi:hypothetical protein